MRSQAGVARIGDMSVDRISVRLSLVPGSEPLSGWATPAGGRTRPFQGWLELAAVLQRLLEEGPGEGHEPECEDER